MPKVKANNITMNYDQKGSGEPLILIPYLAADHACYAFQVAEYAKHYTSHWQTSFGAGQPSPSRRSSSSRTPQSAMMQRRSLAGSRRRRRSRSDATTW